MKDMSGRLPEGDTPNARTRSRQISDRLSQDPCLVSSFMNRHHALHLKPVEAARPSRSSISGFIK